MNNLVINGFGQQSSNQVINGFGAATASELSMEPATGDIAGGDLVNIYGARLSVSNYGDSFQGTVLDTSKWSDISSAAPTSVSVNNQLILTSVAGIAAVKSVATYKNFDLKIGLDPYSANDLKSPTYAYDIHRIVVYIDTDNQIIVANSWDPSLHKRVSTITVINAAQSTIVYTDQIGLGSSVRLRRFNGTVIVGFGAARQITINGWSDAAANIVLSNKSAGAAVVSRINYMSASILATFGTSLAEVIRHEDEVLRVTTPTGPTVGPVAVLLHTPSKTVEVSTTWAYRLVTKLTAGGSTTLYIADDLTLRD